MSGTPLGCYSIGSSWRRTRRWISNSGAAVKSQDHVAHDIGYHQDQPSAGQDQNSAVEGDDQSDGRQFGVYVFWPMPALTEARRLFDRGPLTQHPPSH
jgi:hypothetical protein